MASKTGPKQHRRPQPGSAPGLDLSAPGPDKAPRLILMDFDDRQLDEVADASLERCDASLENTDTTTWLHVHGIPSPEVLEALSRSFGHHTLALEDIRNLGQRPKVEDYDDELFVVVNYAAVDDLGEVQLQQVSIFLGSGYVVSFHEGPEDIFEPVRRRLRKGGSSRIRTRGADYLLYTLLDIVVDSGFPALERISDHLEEMEEQTLAEPSRKLQHELHQVRRMLIALRRGLAPQRDLLNALIRDEHPLVQEANRVYLRDCHDHSMRILDTLDTLRELVLSNQEIYMSSLTNRMNDIMKVLTMIATIFIPLSFFTGLYGMNFNREASPWNMPELDWYYGYPLLLVVLATVAGAMIWFFKRKDWF